MNLDDIRVAARLLLGTLDTTNMWKDSVLDSIVNMAQRAIWRKVAGYNPDLCASVAKVTYPTDSLRLDLETALTANVERIMAVTLLQSDADPSATNPTYGMRPVHLEDIDSPRWAGSPGQLAMSSYTTQTAQFWFAMSGRSIMLRPIPTEDVYLWVRYVPLPAALSGDTDPVFDGELVGLHDLVLYRTLRLCATRSKEASSHYSSLETDAWKDALPLLESQSCEPLPPRHVSSG